MKMLRYFFILAILPAFTLSAETTLVLQNGLNGYSGCQDLYIGNDKLSEVYPDANDNTSWMLVIGKYVC